MCLITEQHMIPWCLCSIPEACCREYNHHSSNRTSPPFSWQTIRKARCCSRCENLSAFNGIVNRNVFPRGPEQNWHCCCWLLTLQTVGSHTLTYWSHYGFQLRWHTSTGRVCAHMWVGNHCLSLLLLPLLLSRRTEIIWWLSKWEKEKHEKLLSPSSSPC